MIVLVVDDEPVARMIVCTVVRKLGHTVLEAEDGLHAWEQIQTSDVSIIITDWQMPGLDGPALIQRIRQANLPHYISCILLTVRNQLSDRFHGLDAGADDYLVKPVDPDELRARITVASRVLTLERELRTANERLQALAVQLQHQALHDQLTGLLNRQGMYNYSAAEFSRAQRNNTALGVALLDIDFFKQINDDHGHTAGDLALVHVANQIRAMVRPYDLIGRWGGEEFLVLLPDVQLEDIIVIAERIRQHIANQNLVIADSIRVPMTASIGITSSIIGAHDLDTIVAAADQALYAAKANGRNQVCSHA